MTLWGGTLTVGHAALFSCVPDPSELRATRVGHGGPGPPALALEPAGEPGPGRRPRRYAARLARTTPHAHVLHGARGPVRPPGTVHPDAPRRRGRPLARPGLQRRRRSTARRSSRRVSTPRRRWSCPGPNPEVTVSYTFRRSGFPGRGWSLTFRTEPPGAAIPPTALVAHPRTVPLSIDDGAIVGRVPRRRDGATFPIDSGDRPGEAARPGLRRPPHRPRRPAADPPPPPRGRWHARLIACFFATPALSPTRSSRSDRLLFSRNLCVCFSVMGLAHGRSLYIMHKIVAGTPIRESRMELNGFWNRDGCRRGSCCSPSWRPFVVAMLVESDGPRASAEDLVEFV